MNYTHEQRETIAEAARIRREARKEATRARPKSPKADRGRERDNGFLAYLRRQPCSAAHLAACRGPVQAAHIRYRVASIPNSAAAGVKNHDRHANPLCAGHHERQHQMNEAVFWQGIGKDAYETAAAHYAAYLSGDDPTAGQTGSVGMSAASRECTRIAALHGDEGVES